MTNDKYSDPKFSGKVNAAWGLYVKKSSDITVFGMATLTPNQYNYLFIYFKIPSQALVYTASSKTTPKHA